MLKKPVKRYYVQVDTTNPNQLNLLDDFNNIDGDIETSFGNDVVNKKQL